MAEKIHEARIFITSAFLLSVIAGCGQWPKAQYPITVQTPKSQALINIEDPELARGERSRVLHLDAFEHVEIAHFETNNRALDIVYDIALGEGLVLEYPYTMAEMVEPWNCNRDQPKTWGTECSTQAWHGMIDYQLYRLPQPYAGLC